MSNLDETYDIGAVGYAASADDFSGGYAVAEETVMAPAYEAPPDDGAFFSSATPLEDANPFGDAPPSSGNGAPAPPAAMADDDPRILWAKKNAEAVAEKDKQEAADKAQLLQSAQAYLKQQAEARAVLLSKRKATNREAEAVANVAQDSVPKGSTPWERAVSIINFNADGMSKDPFKELSRFKSVILEAKKVNLPVGA